MNEGMMWAYKATAKQTAGGGGTLAISVNFVERCRLLTGIIGPNAYAAGRACRVEVYDVAGNITQSIASKSLDNQRLPFPWADVSTAAISDGVETQRFDVYGSGDELRIVATSTILNEELTVILRMLIRTSRPVVDIAESAGTPTLTVAYDRVI